MLSLLHAEEASRFADIVALSPNEVLAREVQTQWGVQGVWPKDARLAKRTDEFWWIDRQLTRLKGGDNHDIQQGFFIHSEPYVSTDQLSLEHVLRRRDAVTRKHVPGPTPGSFMATEAFQPMRSWSLTAILPSRFAVCGRWKTTSWAALFTA